MILCNITEATWRAVEQRTVIILNSEVLEKNTEPGDCNPN